MDKISKIDLIARDVWIGSVKQPLTFLKKEKGADKNMDTTNSQPKDFSEALNLELRKGLPIDEAIREAGKKYPQLLAEYEAELLVK